MPAGHQMERWRLLTEDGASAASGLAVDESLMHPYAANDLPPTLRLYTYRSHCALVGRFQDTAAELNLQACASTGTEVNRRPTGGGAIVMGQDQLGIALITHLRRGEVPAHARAIVMEFGKAVALGLARLGIRGEVRGKNDIAVDGRKVAGLGVFIDDRDAVLFHASVLVDLDVPFMLSVLNVPAAKLADKAVASVQDRITTVRRLVGEHRSTDAVRVCIQAGFEEHFGIRFDHDGLTRDERAAADAIAARRYEDPAWIMLRSSGDAPAGSGLLKTPGGLLRIHASLGGDAIKSVMLTGDFMASERALVEIEESLRWATPDRDAVARAVDGAVTRGGGLSGVAGSDLTEAIWQAVLDAKTRRGMTTGSCYYPPLSSRDALPSGRNA